MRHPRTVRLSNLLAVDKTLIKSVLGTMHPDDMTRVVSGLRAALGL